VDTSFSVTNYVINKTGGSSIGEIQDKYHTFKTLERENKINSRNPTALQEIVSNTQVLL
jgi:hypothetical protein